MTGAGRDHRDYLHDVFARLCAIPSPSGSELACARAVAEELGTLGLAVQWDDAGPQAGSDAPGNLLATVAAGGEDGVLLCAHLDTVPPTAPIEPVCEGGGWRNANPGILGADNKAAVAVMLAAARRWRDAPPPIPVELLFTLREEEGLAGAAAFDTARLRSRFGYVFDHATPIGGIVTASPTYFRIDAEFTGLAAHAGIRPEAGRNAIQAAARALAPMRLGRIDAETTANVGLIGGGSGLNVVAERCRVALEVRSLDDGRARELVAEIVDHLHDGANAAECDLDVEVAQLFRGYRQRPGAPHVEAARRALSACGYAPQEIVTGGGSDANAFEAAGFPCVNLANGTERNHQPDERVSVEALEGMLDVTLALVGEAAAC